MTGRQRSYLTIRRRRIAALYRCSPTELRVSVTPTHSRRGFARICKISAAQLDVENASGLSQDTDTGIFTDMARILILPSGLQLLERGIFSCDLSLVGFGISNLYRR